MQSFHLNIIIVTNYILYLFIYFLLSLIFVRDHYLKNAEPFEPEEFPVLLVGNKCDLSDKRAVTLEEVVDWCAKKRTRKPITYIGK